MINAHGGRLVNRVVQDELRKEKKSKAGLYKKISVDDSTVSFFEMIAIGALSPLEGFMCSENYNSVLRSMHLQTGVPWTVPITLKISSQLASELRIGEKCSVCEKNGNILGTIVVQEKFQVDRQLEYQLIHQSTLGVTSSRLLSSSRETIAIGGEIELLDYPSYKSNTSYRHEPAQARKIFTDRGWHRVVAFQNPNPIGNSRESVEKCALDIVDGLFLHPPIDECHSEDTFIMTEIRKYVELIQNYYPSDRVVLGIFPWAKFHAGPREVVMQAIIRKNFGCSHFIVAEKNLDANDCFSILDLQRIFNEFRPEDLEITPIFAEETFYCEKCEAIVTAKTCQHQNHLQNEGSVSNGKAMLSKGALPPLEFSNKDVFPILIDELWNSNSRSRVLACNHNGVQFNPKLLRFLSG
ncbi:hypothetical protein JXJ21_22400 [candidate division KSB1 bacterium]|nr:hypothetical protein [candidate division KSB1 bacterium]